MSVSPELLYTSHQTQWESYLSSDSSIETLLSAKCDQLLLSEEESNVVSGLEMLLSFCDSSLIRLLEVGSDEFVLRSNYVSNQLLLGRSLCRLVSAESSSWSAGFSLGYFDGMLFRSNGDVDVSHLSLAMKDRLLQASQRMVEVPSGEFMMGALKDDEDAYDAEKPRHKVRISRAFLLGKYAVTQVLYESIMGVNPSYFQGSTRPVECVSWCDAVLFCNKLSEKEGLESVYEIPEGLEAACKAQSKDNDDSVDDLSKRVKINLDANGYRLPTEAEWEYAARGNADYKYAGSNTLDEVGWYRDNSGRKTHPVGQKKANGFGLYDMSGNVWEWVWDRSRKYDGSSKTDPVGAVELSFRVDRGGSWDNYAFYARASFRYNSHPSYRYNYIGFRVLRVAE